MSHANKTQSWQCLEAAIRRLDARRRLCEAQIELASLDLLDAKDELEKLLTIRRDWKVMGRPPIPLVAQWRGR